MSHLSELAAKYQNEVTVSGINVRQAKALVAVNYMAEVKKSALIKGLYEFAAYTYQAQVDNYPLSMNLPVTYNNIARLQYLAGNKAKAIEA